MMIGTAESALIARQTSSPDISGSMRSRITSEGCSARSSSRARRPSAATVTLNPPRSRLYRSVSASDSSSSTTRMRAVTVAHTSASTRVRSDVGGVGGVGELPELAREQEPDLLTDVHGVIAHPFELPGDEDHPQPPVQEWLVVGQGRDLAVPPQVQAVGGIVHLGKAEAQVEG